MPTIETNVLPSVQTSPASSWAVGAAGQAGLRTIGRAGLAVGGWAKGTAHQFAALVADLMGPAVFLAYAMMLWNFSDNFGWTSSFLFSSGPMSNWLVWLGVAVLLNCTSNILKRRTTSRH
jgi:hypothetical protein